MTVSLEHISELLASAGVLSAEEKAQLQQRTVTEGESALIEEAMALARGHERPIAEHLARSLGHPALVISESTINTAAISLVPRIIAERNGILPVALDEDTITVAVPELDMGPILDQVQFACGRLVIPVLAAPPLLTETIEKAYAAFQAKDPNIRGEASPHDGPHLTLVREVPPDTSDEQDRLATELIAASQTDLLATSPTPAGTNRLGTPLSQLTPPSGVQRPTSVPLARVDLKQVAVPVVRPAAPTAEAPPIELSEEVVDVLLAEDDPGIATMVKRALEHDGFAVRVAAAGDEAVRLLRELRPQLILLDAMLPGVHGFEICSRVKRSETYRGVPVVMISAVYKGWEQARDIQEVHGADAFIEKPFDVHFLRKMVAGLLGKPLERAPVGPTVREQVQVARERFDEAYLVGDWARAAEAARAWLASDPFDGGGYLEMGNAAVQLGNMAGALTAYEFAVVYAPTSFPAHTNLAMVYERLGFRRRAIDTWRRAQKIAPDPESIARIEERLAMTVLPR